MDSQAAALIAELGLARHPEGGWYRETWRAESSEGIRAGGTAILFLLETDQSSHWHRVDGAELWFWHAGSPIVVRVEQENGAIADVPLGGDAIGGYQPQCLVPASRWQAAEAREGWALVSCVVVPGFEFSGFELAPPGWAPESR